LYGSVFHGAICRFHLAGEHIDADSYNMGMNSYSRYLGATALSLLVGTAAFAQRPATDTNPAPAKYGDKTDPMLKHSDKSFVEDAAKSAMAEIAISRIALEKATSPQVKEFAQMMVSDHTGANSALTAMAGAKGIVLPKQPSVDKWMKKDAKSFDEDYMEKMVDDHQEAVKLFEKETKNGSDPEVVAFATKTLPKLQEHLVKAKEIKKMVK